VLPLDGGVGGIKRWWTPGKRHLKSWYKYVRRKYNEPFGPSKDLATALHSLLIYHTESQRCCQGTEEEQTILSTVLPFLPYGIEMVRVCTSLTYGVPTVSREPLQQGYQRSAQAQDKYVTAHSRINVGTSSCTVVSTVPT
jgi:hypothetical protein